MSAAIASYRDLEVWQKAMDHLAIAHGSLMELETQVRLARRLGYSNEERAGEVLSRSGEVGRMLHGLIRSLRAAGALA
ncbi:MAG TPA: four helix bundle protein [Vicinamibacterales bacterium]|nr:four helix bundle protein [Vicinamibacterales bacterium]